MSEIKESNKVHNT